MAAFTIYQHGLSHEVLVDDQDLVWVSLYVWRLSTHGYAYRMDPDRGFVRLHREVMRETNPKVFIDHINGNRLDNRRQNLRPATPQENAANAAAKSCYGGKARPTPYKGVSYRRGRWRMNIKLPDGTKIDRLYRNPVAAAVEYDRLALLHYGEFARQNFPDGPPEFDPGKVVVLDQHVDEGGENPVVPLEQGADEPPEDGPAADFAADPAQP